MTAHRPAPIRQLTALLGLSLLLSACGGNGGSNGPGGPSNHSTLTYSLSASVSGLLSGDTLVLQDNGRDNLTITANGIATFNTLLASGANYAVTALTQPAGETCAVADGSGTVAASNVTNVAVTCSGNPYEVRVTVKGLASVPGLVLEDNGGDDLAVSSSGTYTFRTPVASGGAYAVTILDQPTAGHCFVAYGTGTMSDAKVNILVTCPWQVAYFAESGRIAIGYIDQATGVPFVPSTNTSSGVVTFPAPASISNLLTVAVDPSGRFLFAGTGQESVSPPTGTVQVFSIDPGNGALTAIGNPVNVGYARSIAIAPSGNFLYVTTGTGIAGFTIDSTSGALTPNVAGSSSQPADSLTVHASGQFLYAIAGIGSLSNTSISGYTINPATGALSVISGASAALGATPEGAVIDPAGKFLYVPEEYGDDLRGFAIGSSGGLTPIPGLPITGLFHASSAGIDPTGKFLYVDSDSGLGGYSIDPSTGGLAPMAGSPFPLPGDFIVNPALSVMYIGSIAYALDPMTGAPGPALNQNWALTSGPTVFTTLP